MVLKRKRLTRLDIPVVMGLGSWKRAGDAWGGGGSGDEERRVIYLRVEQ